MRPPSRRHTIRILAGLLLSLGALCLVRAEERPTKWRWDETHESWVAVDIAPSPIQELLAPAPPATPPPTPPAAVQVPFGPKTIEPDPPVSATPTPIGQKLPETAPGSPTPPESAQPPIPVEEPVPAAPAGGDGYVPFWTKVPPVTPMPRPGTFVIPPGGPGYYSLLDVLRDKELQDRPKQPLMAVAACFFSFFDADFRYLDDPNNTQFDWLDPLKRIHPNDNWLLSLGGEFRYRYMDEINSRLSGKNNMYSLFRERAYADVWYRDRVRAYIEFIGAQADGFSLPPLAIDRNQADIQNLFVEVKVLEVAGEPVDVRVGRQELLYGSQRLISPLDWANTRRTFQGAKIFWHGCDWDIDGFWVKPVIVNPFFLDTWDVNQNFSGAWVTWKPKKGTTWDLYVLNLNNASPIFVGSNGVKGGLDVTTLGTRTAGDIDGRFLWDFEGMVQTGIRSNQEVVAGAYTLSGGYCAKNVPWTPTFWAAWDWASGNQNPGAAGHSYGTFNQLFPFGHYYFGYMDFVGRQNIEDANLQLSFYPARWLTTILQFHNFNLVSPKDALYNAGGAVLRSSPKGTAGRFVGDEIDFVENIHLTTHQDLFLGYSHFFPGTFVQKTGSPLPADLFYLQYCYKW